MKEAGGEKKKTNLDKLKQIFAKQCNAIKAERERAVEYVMSVLSLQPSVTF